MNNVLIVDDEMPMRAALEASFRRSGWRVQTAAGVSDALSKFRSAPFELVNRVLGKFSRGDRAGPARRANGCRYPARSGKRHWERVARANDPSGEPA